MCTMGNYKNDQQNFIGHLFSSSSDEFRANNGPPFNLLVMFFSRNVYSTLEEFIFDVEKIYILF